MPDQPRSAGEGGAGRALAALRAGPAGIGAVDQAAAASLPVTQPAHARPVLTPHGWVLGAAARTGGRRHTRSWGTNPSVPRRRAWSASPLLTTATTTHDIPLMISSPPGIGFRSTAIRSPPAKRHPMTCCPHHRHRPRVEPPRGEAATSLTTPRATPPPRSQPPRSQAHRPARPARHASTDGPGLGHEASDRSADTALLDPSRPFRAPWLVASRGPATFRGVRAKATATLRRIPRDPHRRTRGLAGVVGSLTRSPSTITAPEITNDRARTSSIPALTVRSKTVTSCSLTPAR